ncbi:L-rhamnose mutarotase [Marinilongibacter aquaticus]|uniref:L-rhamnose mutarotase n=1 Tax=Marinilongibacter aquaticus TaxID=2975157 RepID=UPI0021BD6777|nr:L-rhamnose mutarotase [Marinilongibacter aquaticus]UBM58347.1 L-rhamnose mutarotase [Marinilongibacter aquaticus]
MKIKAFKMKLKAGQKEEYTKRHAAIWPELKTLLEQSGIAEYHIFLDEETNILFAFQKSDAGPSNENLKGQEIMQKWWAHMAELMEVNEDLSPKSSNLEKVFTL